MRWPWCPAPRAGTLLAEQTRKKCCVVWTNRAAGGLPVGRSLVSFYPGWDGSLETDLSMWKQEKILIVCSRVNIFFLFGSWCGPPALFPNYSRTPLSCVSKHSTGGAPWKALDAEEDRSQPPCLCPHATHTPFYSLRNLLQPHLLFPSQDPTLKPWARGVTPMWRQCIGWGLSTKLMGLGLKETVSTEIPSGTVFKHSHWRLDAAKTQRTSKVGWDQSSQLPRLPVLWLLDFFFSFFPSLAFHGWGLFNPNMNTEEVFMSMLFIARTAHNLFLEFIAFPLK